MAKDKPYSPQFHIDEATKYNERAKQVIEEYGLLEHVMYPNGAPNWFYDAWNTQLATLNEFTAHHLEMYNVLMAHDDMIRGWL